MEVFSFLKNVREKKPLIHHLTNWVTIYDCAQIVKSFGASPVMAHAPEEAADMCSFASALVLNIGTLTTEFIDSMKIAAKRANERNIPVVLDVCGAGATPFRDKKCSELIAETKINIIKGNSSEIARIAGLSVTTRGVDAGEVTRDHKEICTLLAKEKNCTVVMTGKEDIIADSKSVYIVKNGCDMMPHVVGTGCMASSVIGTFAGANPENIAAASAAGLCCYELASELAIVKSDGPLSFKHNLMDSVYNLTEKDILSLQKVVC